MNFISQFLGAIHRISEDDRLHATHVSLYVALFALWNLNRFNNPISIHREEVMNISKIGSKNTYHRCLKELHDFGFLIYYPSRNPLKGSLVEMLSLENQGAHHLPNKYPKNDTSGGTSPKQVVGPSLNNTKPSKPNSSVSDFEKRSKVGEEPQPSGMDFLPPLLTELKEYFKQKNYPEVEADKFFNHYQAVGWKIGGKAPIKNWRAAADNWMINASKFNASKKPSGLFTTNEKDYGQPL